MISPVAYIHGFVWTIYSIFSSPTVVAVYLYVPSGFFVSVQNFGVAIDTSVSVGPFAATSLVSGLRITLSHTVTL